LQETSTMSGSKGSSPDQKRTSPREMSKRQFTDADFSEFDQDMAQVAPYDEEEDDDFEMDSSSESGTEYESAASRDMTPEIGLTDEEERRMIREEGDRWLEELLKRPETEEREKDEKKEE
ncbi:hypothetical protein PFISCL1PPCAC_16852, partial [Pristionchus fissidentatus]